MPTIKFKRRLDAEISSLNMEDGEPAFATDSHHMYVDNSGTKYKFTSGATVDAHLVATGTSAHLGFPSTWYWADTSFYAKTVVSAADRYIVLSPNAMQLDIGGSSYVLTSQATIDLSVSTNWGKNVAARTNTTSYVVGDVIPTPTTSAWYWECTTAGQSAGSDPGSWGTAVNDTKVDGGVTWTARCLNPTVAANRAGKDWYIYACQPLSGTIPLFKFSPNSTIPYGYTANNSRKLGGFHTLCVSMSVPDTRGNTTAYSVGKTVLPAVPNGYWYRSVVNKTWTASTAYVLNDLIFGSGGSTNVYECTVAGTASTVAPTWPASGTVTDGGVTWTYRGAIGAELTSGGSAPTYGTTEGSYTLDGHVYWICELQHTASGYLLGDVIPNSIWDLKKRSYSGNEGMVYVEPLDEWVDIYLASGIQSATVSTYGGTISDTRNWMDFVDDGKKVKKQLLRDSTFQTAATGSNEETNITGSTDPVTAGGHTDTVGRRMISNYFLEDCCGALWQWLDENSYRFDGATIHTHSVTVSGDAQTVTSGNASADVAPAWAWYDNAGSRGSLYIQGTYGQVKLRAGGSWTHASYAGSRARIAYYFRWNVGTDIGARFAARSQVK